MRFLLALAAFAALTNAAVAQESAHSGHVAADEALSTAIAGAWRPDTDRARDQYRHPEEALRFWGLRPGMTIVEIQPGGGSWWTKILAPYAHATDGRYIAGHIDLGAPNVSENARNARASFLQEYANAAIYGEVAAVDFGMHSGLALPDASADFILVARAFHGWAGNAGMTDRYMSEFARVLRPGGVLAVEQHRAAEGANVEETRTDGYVPEAYVIEAAERAGLTLAARSEINANPRDDRDHPFGVWTLPPTRRSAESGQEPAADFDRAAYDAIGESDRMTLRFVRPS
ncbi:MAG: class I SAM-dependent methyltransferase [Hyphomonadaceae bacterium]